MLFDIRKVAGIPNIQGQFTAVSDNWTRTGPFTNDGGTGQNFNAGTTGWPIDRYYGFNASRVSSIYGNSNTVTPLSLTTAFYIKFGTGIYS